MHLDTERRSHQRLKPHVPLFVNAPTPKRVRDISLAGAFIETDHLVSTGNQVNLSFRSPRANPITVRAVIRRAEPQAGMAVEFVEGAASQSGRLRELVQLSTQGAAGAGAAVESSYGRRAGVLGGGYRFPPSRARTRRAARAPRAHPVLFSAVLLTVFMLTFALGLTFLHYRAQQEAALRPQPAEVPAARLAVSEPPASTPLAQPGAKAEIPKAPPQTPAAQPSVAAGLVVQVAAYEDRGEAEALARKLSSQYHRNVVVAPAQVRGKTYYRIQIPVATREEAARLARRLAAEHKFKPWIHSLP